MTTSIHDVSLTSATVAPWTLKTALVTSTAGVYNWRIVSSGSGSGGVYAQSGDVITSQSVLANAGAWWVAEGHGVADGGTTYRRQVCWQTDGVGGLRAKVSPRGGFTGGSPSATRTPSATDERQWIGGGTDASPTYDALFPSSGAWLQGQVSETDDFFYLISYPVAGGPCSALLALGTLALQRDGSGNLIDKDPAVYYARAGASAALASSLASEAYGPLGHLAYGDEDDAAWVRLPAALRCVYDASGPTLQPVIPGGLPQSPSRVDAAYAADTLRLGRRGALAGTTTGAKEAGNLNTCGDKGEELRLRYSGRLYTVPTVLDSVDPSTGLTVGSALLALGNLVFPWSLGLAVRDGA